MNNQPQVFSNNVFDIDIIGAKDFKEMISNFIDAVNLILPSVDNNSSSLTPIQINHYLKKIGIITSKQDITKIKKIIGEVKYQELIKSLELIYFNNENIPELEKYILEERIKKEKSLEKNAPKIVDLFCGAGGLSLGFSQEGFKTIFSNDIDKSALRTYSFNHPEIGSDKITIGGIEDIAHNVGKYINDKADVLIGGPPCQGFSMANRQRLIDDPRNILYKYYVQCVDTLQPKFFIMENVKGMKSVADQVVFDFNNNKENYDIDYEIFNIKEFGVPQNRERLIIIGVRLDLCKKYNINASSLIQQIKTFKNEEITPLIDAISDLKELKASHIKNSTESNCPNSGSKIMKKNYTELPTYVKVINKYNKETRLIYNHKARYNNERDIEIFSRLNPGDDSSDEKISDIMPYKNRGHIFKDKYYKLKPDVPCKTITAHMKFDCNMYIHPFQSRGLTPREAARIQSYPDDYFFLGPYTKTFMQIGNSVPPLFSNIIAKIIKQYL